MWSVAGGGRSWVRCGSGLDGNDVYLAQTWAATVGARPGGTVLSVD
ncbi:hypothetical protein [Kitasatospora aureofaciens]